MGWGGTWAPLLRYGKQLAPEEKGSHSGHDKVKAGREKNTLCYRNSPIYNAAPLSRPCSVMTTVL